MLDPAIYFSGLAAAMGVAIMAWLVSIPLRDVGVADSVWPLYFVVMAAEYLGQAPILTTRSLLTFFLATLWASRLCAFITRRQWDRGEDRRYLSLRQTYTPGFERTSLYLVFGPQAVLAWVLSLALHAAILGSAPLGWLDIGGTVLCIGAVFWEAIADQQLASFLARPANRNGVLDRGLWRYSRHPNYFGEAGFWWGLYLLALGAGAWWALIAPLLVTLILVRGGIPLVERDIALRRPGYGDYARRTNAFLPGLPRPPEPRPD